MWAFARCSSLSSISLPEGVASIGDRVFSNCIGDFILIITRGSYAETYAKKITLTIVILGRQKKVPSTCFASSLLC
ncbi:MAG: leucine-rich repeat domain-containing protein [Lachnospiraceae bacterium]